jgi:hypothetical protein
MVRVAAGALLDMVQSFPNWVNDVIGEVVSKLPGFLPLPTSAAMAASSGSAAEKRSTPDCHPAYSGWLVCQQDIA